MAALLFSLIFLLLHNHIGELLKVIQVLITTKIIMRVFVPLYIADVPSWIAHKETAQVWSRARAPSRLNVGQQKVASEGKWIKVGSSPPPLSLVLSLVGACFWQGHLSPPVGRGSQVAKFDANEKRARGCFDAVPSYLNTTTFINSQRRSRQVLINSGTNTHRRRY